jgi:hypothetical protein
MRQTALSYEMDGKIKELISDMLPSVELTVKVKSF